jgi:hypothetical protein
MKIYVKTLETLLLEGWEFNKFGQLHDKQKEIYFESYELDALDEKFDGVEINKYGTYYQLSRYDIPVKACIVIEK